MSGTHTTAVFIVSQQMKQVIKKHVVIELCEKKPKTFEDEQEFLVTRGRTLSA